MQELWLANVPRAATATRRPMRRSRGRTRDHVHAVRHVLLPSPGHDEVPPSRRRAAAKTTCPSLSHSSLRTALSSLVLAALHLGAAHAYCGSGSDCGCGRGQGCSRPLRREQSVPFVSPNRLDGRRLCSHDRQTPRPSTVFCSRLQLPRQRDNPLHPAYGSYAVPNAIIITGASDHRRHPHSYPLQGALVAWLQNHRCLGLDRRPS